MDEEPSITLSGHFQGRAVDSHPEAWNSLWKDHKFTPWDRGGPSLALLDVLEQRTEIFGGQSDRRGKKALVPGCGRGHDVLLLASLGYDVYGLEASPSALEEARKNAESRKDTDEQHPGSIHWVAGNFLKDQWTTEAGVDKFDLIFDYTFFCALPPSVRPGWAKRMSELLAPDGRLVCLEFPSTKPSSEGGPPWAAPPYSYIAYLNRPGQEPATDEHGGVLADKVGEPEKGALQRILHMKPPRSHSAGVRDGEMLDCISVWRHY